tara:strand:+ start:1043 stop:2710 length:1668 start_codon:yes stop_codon:yes gene_type:complete
MPPHTDESTAKGGNKDAELSKLRIMAASARNARGNYDTRWQECARLAAPRDAIFNVTPSPGSDQRDEQYHEGAELALDESSSMFKAFTTPDGQRWHGLQSPELGKDDKESQQAYEDIENILFKYRYIPNARYASARYEAVRSYQAFGNCFMYIEKGDKDTPIRYRYVHLSQAYITVDSFDVMNGIFYIRELTPRQIIDEYGEENVSQKIKDQAANPATYGTHDTSNTFTVAHSVMDNPDYKEGSLNREKLKYSSRHFLLNGENEEGFLREGGYNTFPYVVCRDTHAPNEIYGRGKLQKILPAIKMLNQMKKTAIIAGHNAVLPPLLMRDDSSINPAHIVPEGVVVGGLDSQGNPTIAPLLRGQNMDLSEGLMAIENATIERVFHLNLYISNLDDSTERRTATEVRARLQDQSRIIGPEAARDEVEFLGPQIERELDILGEMGLIEGDFDFDVIYRGVLSKAQKSDDVMAAINTIEFVMLAASANPEIVETVSWWDAVDIVNEGNGAPPRLIKSLEAFTERVAKMQEEAKEQSMLENGGQFASGIANAASTLVKEN